MLLYTQDTAGQERFQSLGVAFYRGSDACILCYDITDNASFQHIDNWRNEFLMHVGINSIEEKNKFPFVLLGNKVDIVNENADKRAVSIQQVTAYCNTHNNIQYYETSAKDDSNVEQAFITVAKQALKLQQERKPIFIPDTLNLQSQQQNNRQHTQGCCQ